MLSIFSGDDTVSSRNAFTIAKTNFIRKGSTLIDVDGYDLLRIDLSGGTHTDYLFGGRPIYTTTNLVKTIKKTFLRKAKDKLRELAMSREIDVLDWEDLSSYDLGIYKDRFEFVNDHKAKSNSFTLLARLRPSNQKIFLSDLCEVSDTQAIEVTFSMLRKNFKLALLLKSGLKPKDNPNVLRNATITSQLFTTDKLLEIYRRLLKAELNSKSGSNTPLTIKEQIETVMAFLL
jgi:hypothetical protein